MSKNDETPKRFWLDPRKNTTGIPVPPWEGTCNPPPLYMDLVLYNMHRIHKEKLKRFTQVHKQMNMEEILSTFCYYEKNEHEICLPHKEKDTVLLVSKHQLGYVVAYSKDGGEYETRLNRIYGKKWDYAIVEFQNTMKWSVAKSVKIYGKMSSDVKMLTMHDRNFMLAKACEFTTLEELQKHVMGWKPEN